MSAVLTVYRIEPNVIPLLAAASAIWRGEREDPTITWKKGQRDRLEEDKVMGESSSAARSAQGVLLELVKHLNNIISA